CRSEGEAIRVLGDVSRLHFNSYDPTWFKDFGRGSANDSEWPATAVVSMCVGICTLISDVCVHSIGGNNLRPCRRHTSPSIKGVDVINSNDRSNSVCSVDVLSDLSSGLRDARTVAVFINVEEMIHACTRREMTGDGVANEEGARGVVVRRVDVVT